jgi:hypothetical protein
MLVNSAPVRSYTNPNKGPAARDLTTDAHFWIGPRTRRASWS